MDGVHYREMLENLDDLERNGGLKCVDIYLFGYCNATEELADLLRGRGYEVAAILDNNLSKQGTVYHEIPVLPPETVIRCHEDISSVICIAARAYEAMSKQLRQLGYHGKIYKMIDYDSYAEYSLSDETLARKWRRLCRGMERLQKFKERYPGYFRIYCPFSALGDIYYMLSYLPYYLESRKISDYVICVIGDSLAQIAEMFGVQHIETFTQREIDEQIQAVLYTNDSKAFIPHQDRPYTATLYKALYIKKIPLEMIYQCGVFGLTPDHKPYRPVRLRTYAGLFRIPKGKSVILSPYAKSVTNISPVFWKQIIRHFTEKGYRIYTNAAEGEEALAHTESLTVSLDEMQSVVEWAGIFIGLRSGLCDVLKWADCRKIALYPDVYYSDTRWKMEEIYHLEGWENIVAAIS